LPLFNPIKSVICGRLLFFPILKPLQKSPGSGVLVIEFVFKKQHFDYPQGICFWDQSLVGDLLQLDFLPVV